MKLSRWPEFAPDEIAAAMDVLESGKVNYWTGEQGTQFETEFARYTGAKYAVAMANGSVGLDAALRVLGIGLGDEVIVPARSFFASAGAIALTGATPAFADVDRRSQNISLETIKARITPRTRAILCVHLYGWPCDMTEIVEFAKEQELYVVEDCAQAHGAKIDGVSIGTLGDIGVFSFCQDKIMTTGGEGGMLITDQEDLWQKAWSYKDHGKSYSKVHADNHPPGFRWLHESFGTNLRMTEMQAAIGRIQLRKLDAWVQQRRENARIFTDMFGSLECLRIEEPADNLFHSYYKYGIFVRPERLADGWNRDRILQEFAQNEIPVYSGSCPEIYLESAFTGTPSEPSVRLRVARELGETSLQFLVHPTLTHDEVRGVAEAAHEILMRAQRN